MPKVMNAINAAARPMVLAGILAAIAALFVVNSSPMSFAQTDTTAPAISSVAITSDPNDDPRIDGWTFDSGVYGIGDSI